jgi:WD40 repeat protein
VTTTLLSAPPSPYKGLAAFEDSDADAYLFFGRELEADVIAANLMASRITVLYGPSGVGKSSVLRAGVAFRLRREEDVHIAILSTWTGDPVRALIDAVGGSGERLADALEEVAAQGGRDLYLILDQFEECFLYHRDGGEFAVELAEVIGHPTLRVNVLIGIREDAIAQLDVLKAAIPNLLSNRLRLERLDRKAAEEAILRPVDRYNELVGENESMRVEPELVARVLDEVVAGRVDLGVTGRGVAAGGAADDRIEAPYLQLVLSRLWEVERDRGSRLLQVETLRELGGAVRIVEDHLEHAMAELSLQQKDAAEAMYNFLVTPSGTKIAHGVSDLARYAHLDEDEAGRVLRSLAAERIVRATSENGGPTRYEIYHDVLAQAVAAWRSRHGAERALRDAERRRRRALGIAAAALVGLALFAAIAVFALVERGRSHAQARRAHARELVATAVAQLERDPRKSVRLALDSAGLEPGSVEEDGLRRALLADTQRAVLRAGGPVRIVRFDSTGRHVLSASVDGKVRIYRLGSTSPERVLDQGGRVTSAEYGPGGLVLTAGTNGTARLWRSDGSSMTLVAGGPITSASFGDGGRLVVATTANNLIRSWRTSDGRRLRTIRMPMRERLPLSTADPARPLVVTFGQDRFARVFNVESGRRVRVLAHPALVHCAAFSPDASKLLTCRHDGSVDVWTPTGRLVRRLRGPDATQPINAVAFSPYGRLVAGAVHDGTARIWNFRTGQLVATMFGHMNAVSAVAFSPKGNAIVSGGLDNLARTWLSTGRPARLLSGHTAPIEFVAFSPNGRLVATASDDRTARLWESGTEPDLQVVAREPSLKAFGISRDGRRVVTADARGMAFIRSLGSGRILATRRVSRSVTDIAMSSRGLYAAALPDLSVAVSPDGVVAYGRSDGTVRLTDPQGRGRRVFHSGGAVTAIAFSHDGTLIATGSTDGTVRLWDASSGARRDMFQGPRFEVTSLAFSPDGKTLLTGNAGREARVWDIDSGRVIRVLGLHFGRVESVGFSRDGKWIVTAGCCGASVIKAATGERSLVLRGHAGPLVGAAFGGRDGNTIVTAGTDGTLRTYRCNVCGGIDELMSEARRRLTEDR